MTTAVVLARSEYDDLRQRRPSRLSFLSSPRLVVLPDRFMRLYGGAAVLYRWTCIGQGLLDAPADVRKAILAHEWGHVARGHGLVATAALIALLVYLLHTTVATALAALLIVGVAFCWVTQTRRELEADDVAVALVGAAHVADGLAWCVEHYAAGRPSRGVRVRLKRLRSMPNQRKNY